MYSFINEEKKRAAIYTRVSTTDQADKGYGLDVQKERCRGMIISKGWTEVGLYEDAGISGTYGPAKRPALARMISDIEGGKIDVVVVNSLDRLARKTILVLELVNKFLELGVSIVSSKESLDTSTPMGKFALTLSAGISQLERDTIVERTTAGREKRGKLDGEKGGVIPLGYERTKTGIAVKEEEAGIVRTIIQLRDEGFTLRDIAKTLNDNSVKTRKGNKWYASTVKYVIDNRDKYIGGFRGDSSVRWPAILDIDVTDY